MKLTKESPPEIICPKCSGRGAVIIKAGRIETCFKCKGNGTVKGYPKERKE